MKKVLLSVAVVAAAMFVSCTSSADKAERSTSDFKTKIENCTNPDSLTVYVNEAKAYAQKLVAEGKIDEAKKYMAQIEPVVKEKAPALAGTFDTVKEALDKVPGAVADKTEEVKDAVSDKAEEVGAAVSDKASEVTDAVADKAGEVKDAVVDKTKDAAAAVSNKAGEVKDAVSNKIDELKK